MSSCVREKAPCACCGVERAEVGGSGACAVACAALTILRDYLAYEQAVDAACASGCAGVGGGVRGYACKLSVASSGVRSGADRGCAERTPPYARAGADAAADGDVDEPPCACARHSRQIAAVVRVGNGRTGAVGTRAVGIGRRVVPRCASRCRNSGRG